MKISQKFPQFEKEKALIIVAGRLETDFHIAFGGEITKVASFKITKPRYSDREGFVARASGGKAVSGGPSYSIDKEKINSDFLKVFKEKIKPFSQNKKNGRVYLFAESHVVNEIQKFLPVNLKNKIKEVVRGNYSKNHLFDLLEIISAKRS